MKSTKFWLIVLLTILLGTANVSAQVSDQVSIHGFGGWGYGKTNGNHYLSGNDEGEYHHANYALNVNSSPFENLMISSQVEWLIAEEGMEIEMDYASAEWYFSDALKFCLGNVKHPFGIYSEIYTVGTLRPFLHLPMGLYGGTGIMAEGYLGIGFRGNIYSNKNWALNYHVYGGELYLEDTHAWYILEEDEGEEHEHEEENKAAHQVKDVIGGRVVISTPMQGMSIGISAYSGKPVEVHGHGEGKVSDAVEPSWGDHIAYSIHLEYLSYKFSLRSEYGVHEHSDIEKTKTAYFEVAYNLTEHWQTVARYEWLDTKLPNFDVSEAPSLIEHKDFAVGLNYWISGNFVLKASYHVVEGNRFALPENLHEALEAGDFDKKTNLILFGGQFSF